MTRLLLVCGSQRRESFNARLLAHLARRLRSQCEIDDLASPDVDLPLYNQDLESEPEIVERVIRLHRRFDASNAILVASPEYNGQLTPFLKNLIDWISRIPRIDRRFGSPFVGRPVLLCSASTGSTGGAVAIPAARALFGYVGCVVLGDAICLPCAHQVWTGEELRPDAMLEARIEAGLARLLDHGRAFARTQEPVNSEVAL